MKNQELKVITIDRSTWRRGDMKMNEVLCGDTALLNDLGFKCCLGFHALQLCKATEKIIKGKAEPKNTYRSLKGLSKKIGPKEYSNTIYSINAVDINDDHIMTETEREKRLKALGKEHGYLFKFVGTTPRKYWI